MKALISKFRRSFQFLTFRWKAVLSIVPIILLISGVYTYEAIHTEKTILRKQIIKTGETIAGITARSAELPIISGNQELLKRAATEVKNIPDVSFIAFYDIKFAALMQIGSASGRSIPHTVSADNPMTLIEQQDAFEFIVPVFTIKAGEDYDMFDDTEGTKHAQEHIGWAQIGLSKEVLKKAESDIIRNGIVLAILFSAAGVILVYLFITLATRPLQILFNAIKEIREGEYPAITVIKSRDEFGRLSAEFNKMIGVIKEREDRIVISEKRIKSLFERVEHAIFRLDRDGNIIEANKKFDELCGRPHKFSTLFFEDRNTFTIQKATGGELKNIEEKIRGTEDRTLNVIISIYPDFDKNNDLTGFDGYFVDISEKKRLKETLRQTQKLESIGMLAGGIAHDFNNILSAILGYSELALMSLPKNSPVRDYLKVIIEAEGRAAALTSQILAFSRKQTLEMKPVNMNILLENLSKMLQRIIGEDIQFLLRTDECVPIVLADAGQIEQVITNLAVNARDAMPDGGSLIVENSVKYVDEACIEQRGIKPGKYIVTCVSDTGVGMEKGTMEKIFEPFFTTKALGKGTGLGLATVYGIIKQHNGHISVYSEPDEGTTFRIYLPALGEEQEEKQEEAETHLMKKGAGTILVVDDELLIQKMIAELLGALGYTIISATGGNEALTLSRSYAGKIDLILTDVVMKDMNGKVLVQKIQEHRGEIAVIYMSGYTHKIIAHHGVLDKGIHFLEKPINLPKLAEMIQGLTGTAGPAADGGLKPRGVDPDIG